MSKQVILNLSSPSSLDTFKKRLKRAYKANPVLIRLIITAPLGLQNSEETILEMIDEAKAKIPAVTVALVVGDCNPFVLKVARMFDHVQMHHRSEYLDGPQKTSAADCQWLGLVNEVWGDAV